MEAVFGLGVPRFSADDAEWGMEHVRDDISTECWRYRVHDVAEAPGSEAFQIQTFPGYPSPRDKIGTVCMSPAYRRTVLTVPREPRLGSPGTSATHPFNDTRKGELNVALCCTVRSLMGKQTLHQLDQVNALNLKMFS